MSPVWICPNANRCCLARNPETVAPCSRNRDQVSGVKRSRKNAINGDDSRDGGGCEFIDEPRAADLGEFADLHDQEGKVAIITGGTSGVEEATAHLFAKEGAKMVILARREEQSLAVQQAICAEGGDALFIP